MKRLVLLCSLLVSMFGFSQIPELIYYRFENSSTNVQNEAQNPVGNNPATLTGLTTSTGGMLSSMALSGTGGASGSNVINTGWPTAFNGSFTIAFWTSNIVPSTTLWYIFGDVGATSFRCFTNGFAGANNWIIRGAGLPDLLVNGAATAAPNMIHAVYNAAAGTYTSYVNGVFNTQVTAPTSLNVTGTGLQVGGYGSNMCLNGKIDEFRWYNRALTPTEISATYNITLIGGGCNINTQPTGNDTTFCSGAGTLLQATPGSMQNSVIWTNSSGQFLYSGNTYLTQPLYANTFFVAHDANMDTIGAHVGPLTSISAQGYQNSNNGLYATVHGYMFFDSVTVRTDGTSSYRVKVWDHSQTNLIAESNPRFSIGNIDVKEDVGILLGPGNYFFTIEQVSGNAQYFRATSGANYPYEIQGLVSIDSSSGGNMSAYYYLFDWVVRGICIDSTGTIVNVTEIPAGASATGTQQNQSSTESLWQFNGAQSVGATSYNWDFGNGSSASGVNVFHAYVANGSYQVILTVDTDCGPKSDTLDIIVAGIGLEESGVQLVNVFPNPTRDQVVITFESGQAQTIRMELVNSIGQQIWAETVQNHSGTYRKELSLGAYAKGIYHLRIHTATGTHTERISLQ